MPSAISIYTEIFTYLNTILTTFSTVKSQAIWMVIEPTVSVAWGLIFLFQGLQFWMGASEQPLVEFLTNAIRSAFIITVAGSAEMYNAYFIQTFQNSPIALASGMIGADGVTTVNGVAAILDATLNNVLTIFNSLVSQASITTISPLILAGLVLFVGGGLTLLAGFLIFMSEVFLAIILSVGPLFIFALLFKKTENYFTRWVDSLIGYGLITLLAVTCNAFILSMFEQYATQLAANHGTLIINDCIAVIVSGGFGFMALWKVPELAASLGGGIAISPHAALKAAAKQAKNTGQAGFDKITDKRGRDNQRQAEDRVDVNRRVKDIENPDRSRKLMPRNEIRRY
jgi:type IV secretion system protein VirB6